MSNKYFKYVILLMLFILIIFILFNSNKIEKFQQDKEDDDYMVNRSVDRFNSDNEDINNMGKGRSWGPKIIRGGDFGPISPDGIWAWIPGGESNIQEDNKQEAPLFPVYSCGVDEPIEEERKFKCVEWNEIPKENKKPIFDSVSGEVINQKQNQKPLENGYDFDIGPTQEQINCDKPCTKEDREKIADCHGDQLELDTNERQMWVNDVYGRCNADGSENYVCISGKGDKPPCGGCSSDVSFWSNSSACDDCCRLEDIK